MEGFSEEVTLALRPACWEEPTGGWPRRVFQAEVTSRAKASGRCQLGFCWEAEGGQRWGQPAQATGLQQVELGFEPRGMCPDGIKPAPSGYMG